MVSDINNNIQQKVLALLLMRFNVSPAKSLDISKRWLNNHPNSTWEDLYNSVNNNLITVKNLELIDLYDQKISKLVNDMKGKDGIEIKDRRYYLKTYSQCFIGSEAVEWMQKKYKISQREAIKLGQNLVDKKIIHHVTDDHQFKNDFLFYTFYPYG